LEIRAEEANKTGATTAALPSSCMMVSDFFWRLGKEDELFTSAEAEEETDERVLRGGMRQKID
jgi:hypothetical protein